jgi:cellulose synthase/poly-beta-1,6-N-acetylglucosamine synthase-like glycosyltransferase
MMTWWLALLVIGVNFTIWGCVGGLRLIDETIRRHTGRSRSHVDDELPKRRRMRISSVAVLMAAHNEEMVISASLARLAELVPTANIHVVSDGSSDRTVELAHAAGVNVVETPQNVGKAGALTFGIKHFGLLDRFRAVMVLDADTQLDRRYFQYALPLFDDRGVVAVAGCAHTRWQRHLRFIGNVVVAHRQRIYVLTQLLLKYGQTWRGISATHIVPGFASIYRTNALRHITINRPGLVIEDFNMTFEVNSKQLGRVAFHPLARAYTQDPARYRDYVRQTRRWALGLWQTVRWSQRRRGAFAGALALTLVELVTSSLLFVFVVPLVVFLGLDEFVPGATGLPVLGVICTGVAAHISFTHLAMGILVPDYLLTCAVAAVERRPRFLLAGLLFIPMKITDAAVALYTLPRAWLDRSTGQWVSPTRRAVPVSDGTEVA